MSKTEGTGSYWQDFGFRQAPFEEVMQYAMYYPIAGWQQQLNYLQYLDHSNQPLMVILGVLGSGKSMFVAQLLAQQEHANSSYLLKAGNTLSSQNLLTQVAQAFEIKENLSTQAIAEQAEAIITHLEQRHQTHVLIIDDAHRLPLETLSTLITIANKQKNAQPALFLILLAEPQLQQRIDNLIDVAEADTQVNYFQLPALSFEEMRAYIKHRMQKAGLNADKMPSLTEDTLRRIYDLSGGIPGRINRVVRQTLLDTKRNESVVAVPARKATAHSAGHFLMANQVKMISLGLLIVCGYLLWQYQGKINQLFFNKKMIVADNSVRTVTPTPNAQPPALPETPKSPSQNAVESAVVQANSSASIAPKNNEPVTVANADAVIDHESATEQSKQPLQAGLMLAMQQLKEKENPSTNQTTEEQPSNIAPSSAADTDVTLSSQQSAPSSLKQMQTQLMARQGYSLQLLGLYSLPEIQRFIKKHQLQTEALILVTNHQGKPWYVVLYGQYDTISQAQAALAELPSTLRQQHPWVRPLKTVHEAIRQQG